LVNARLGPVLDLCFSVQGGDSPDHRLVQFFVEVVEFGMIAGGDSSNINNYQIA